MFASGREPPSVIFWMKTFPVPAVNRVFTVRCNASRTIREIFPASPPPVPVDKIVHCIRVDTQPPVLWSTGVESLISDTMMAGYVGFDGRVFRYMRVLTNVVNGVYASNFVIIAYSTSSLIRSSSPRTLFYISHGAGPSPPGYTVSGLGGMTCRVCPYRRIHTLPCGRIRH